MIQQLRQYDSNLNTERDWESKIEVEDYKNANIEVVRFLLPLLSLQ